MKIDLAEYRGASALVTGASSGIGMEFARRLAAAGLNLVVVARRDALLRTLADELAERHRVSVRCLPADLAVEGESARIRKQLAQDGIAVRLLCNCAAFGRWGPVEAAPVSLYAEMLRLNCAALVSMCLEFVEDLGRHPSSVIINVSSPAAYQPIPYMAVYAASKAFVQSFSQALHGEWAARGVLVQTLVPGPTATEFDARAGAYESALSGRGSVAEVVGASLAGLRTGRPVVVSAKGTFKQRLFAGVFPSSVVIREVGKMFRPPPPPSRSGKV
jgi:uncharacterized protein